MLLPQALAPALQALHSTGSETLEIDGVHCLTFLKVLQRLARVDSLRHTLAASGAVQALLACDMACLRGRDHWQTHAATSLVLHRLSELPGVLAFMAALGLRQWLLDVMMCVPFHVFPLLSAS